MVRRLAVGVTCTLLLFGLLASGAVGAALDADGPEPLPPQTAPEGYDSAVFEIEVYENASAQWTIRHSRPLENETEVERFREFARRFEDGETAAFSDFEARARQIVDTGENVTGRSMDAAAFSRAASIESRFTERRGEVELSFRWDGFARSENGQIVVGDVFVGGFATTQGQELRLRRGPSVRFVDVEPEPDSIAEPDDLTDSDTVTWVGERNFQHNRPYAVLEPRNGTGAVSSTAAATPTSGNMEGMLVVGLLVLLGIGSGLAWYTGYLPPGDGRLLGGTTAKSPSQGSDGAAAPDTAPSPTGDGAESEIVSDEDRVLGLLEENGGRMKQVNIVEETEWSKSKVSMLLSDMEDEGEISKLRVGRENIISLAGQEPDAAGSPFDEE